MTKYLKTLKKTPYFRLFWKKFWKNFGKIAYFLEKRIFLGNRIVWDFRFYNLQLLPSCKKIRTIWWKATKKGLMNRQRSFHRILPLRRSKKSKNSSWFIKIMKFYTRFIHSWWKTKKLNAWSLCVISTYYFSGAVVQRWSVKKVCLIISQNSQENTCARETFLIK